MLAGWRDRAARGRVGPRRRRRSVLQVGTCPSTIRRSGCGGGHDREHQRQVEPGPDWDRLPHRGVVSSVVLHRPDGLGPGMRVGLEDWFVRRILDYRPRQSNRGIFALVMAFVVAPAVATVAAFVPAPIAYLDVSVAEVAMVIAYLVTYGALLAWTRGAFIHATPSARYVGNHRTVPGVIPGSYEDRMDVMGRRWVPDGNALLRAAGHGSWKYPDELWKYPDSH